MTCTVALQAPRLNGRFPARHKPAQIAPLPRRDLRHAFDMLFGLNLSHTSPSMLGQPVLDHRRAAMHFEPPIRTRQELSTPSRQRASL